MQMTSDPMRSAKLLFDLMVASGDFPSGSTYLRLLVMNLCNVNGKVPDLKRHHPTQSE